MIELHIWGPAFGLPSFDAECLAAVLYLQRAVPKESWTLVASNSPDSNPFRQLPALRDEQTWIAGFDQIRQYLVDISSGAWNLDVSLSSAQQADCDAYTSFLQAKGMPLLDLSLYVSSDNYTTCTRGALANLLSWPQSWTVPHHLREQAKRRSEHLGLSALDVDAAQEDNAPSSGLSDKIPKSLLKSKQTVSSLLGRGAQKTRFRLDAVTEDFLEPLQTKLGGRSWLVGDNMCSVDCLAVSTISLMQVEALPQAWLSDTLSTKYQQLGAWAKTCVTAATGNSTLAVKIMEGDFSNAELPWTAPKPLSMIESSMNAIEALVSSIPVLRIGYGRSEVECRDRKRSGRGEEKQLVYVKMRREQQMYSQLMTACLGTASVLAWLVHAGVLVVPGSHGHPPRRKNFGEAGAILGL